MKKSNKRFVISTETSNTKKMSVRTSGIDISSYEKNPLMLFMHKLPKGKSKDEVLPIGNFVDLVFEGNTLYGTPQFDDTDEFAMSIFNKVENGTLRMASAGLLPLKWARDDDGRLWLEESVLKEISICDFGSNPDALAVNLYDHDDNLITLSQEFIQSINIEEDMKIIELNDSAQGLLKLAEGATPDEAQKAIQTLVTLAETQGASLITLNAELATSKGEVVTLKAEAEEQIKLAANEKIITLMAGAVFDNKMTQAESDELIKLAAGNFESLKKIVDGREAMLSAEEILKQKTTKTEGLETLSWDELDQSDQLVTLKENNLPLFKAMFKKEHGVEYKDQ